MDRFTPYIDGFVVAVPNDKKAAYAGMAKKVGDIFREYGALSVVEAWGEDVPDGKLTSFPMAVKREPHETVVFSWVVWPSKDVRQAAHEKVMADPRMQPENLNMNLFDGKRMIYGGFLPLVGDPLNAPAVQPYLFFRGRCEEALAYYEKTLGAKVEMKMRFKDNPDKPDRSKVPAELDEKIMHASIRIAGAQIMMSDGMRSGATNFDCMAMTLSVPTEAECDRLFNALAVEGKVEMPVGPAFFAKRFGSVADKFSVSWMIMVPPDAG
ncbi:MAG: DUF1428 family protein [Hyphomicrobiaceae bacterium]